MVFLRRYRYSAIALNFVVSCMVMLYFILAYGLVFQVPERADFLPVPSRQAPR